MAPAWIAPAPAPAVSAAAVGVAAVVVVVVVVEAAAVVVVAAAAAAAAVESMPAFAVSRPRCKTALMKSSRGFPAKAKNRLLREKALNPPSRHMELKWAMRQEMKWAMR